MRKKTVVWFGALLALVAFGGAALSADPIKLVVNGRTLAPEVPPQIMEGNTMVPVRWVAEALGAKVDWDGPGRTVTVDLPERGDLQRQVGLLQQALAAKTAEEAVRTWADAVQSRNGAAQFAMLSESLRERTLKSFEEMGWVTGVSSPWTAGYELSAGASAGADRTGFDVAFELATSDGSAGGGTVKVTVERIDGQWYIAQLAADEEDAGALGGIVMFPTGADSSDSGSAPGGQQPSPALAELPDPHGVQRIDGASGWAWGRDADGTALLRQSADTGEWSRVPLDSLSLAADRAVRGWFADADSGWLGWSDGKAMSLARTTDGGQSWSRQTFPGLEQPLQITFADARNGWLLTSGEAAMMKNVKKVYRTADGGATWRVVSDNTPDSSGAPATARALPLTGHIAGMAFRDAEHGFAAIDNPVSPELLFLQTEDGGATWSSVVLPVPQALEGKVDYSSFAAPVFSGERGMDGVVFARLGSAAGETQVVYTTRDGGRTWRDQAVSAQLAPGARVYPAFADADHGWLLSGSDLYRTEDGGASWSRVTTDAVFRQAVGADPAIRQLAFRDARNGWLVVGGEEPDRALWLETSDGGATWRVAAR